MPIIPLRLLPIGKIVQPRNLTPIENMLIKSLAMPMIMTRMLPIRKIVQPKTIKQIRNQNSTHDDSGSQGYYSEGAHPSDDHSDYEDHGDAGSQGYYSEGAYSEGYYSDN